jgi:hypothetical protein
MTPEQKRLDDRHWQTIEMLMRVPELRTQFAALDYCYMWGYVALNKVRADFVEKRRAAGSASGR